MSRRTPKLHLAVIPLFLLAAPLPAQAADVRDAAEMLSDPVEQDRMAASVTALVDALMRLNVGPLAEAVARADPESDAAYIPSDATLGEIAGRDPDYARRVGDEVRATGRMAGDLAAAAATYGPVLQAMARDLAAQWAYRRDAPQQ